MNIKNRFLTGIIAASAAASTIISCTDDIKFGDSFIEKSPGNTVSLDTVFSSAEYTKQFLTGIYALQYYGLPYNQNSPANSGKSFTSKLDALTDCYQIHWGAIDAYSNFYGGALTAQSVSPISFTGDCVWEVIRECLILINNVDRVPGLSDSEKTSLIAQAKCLMASRYFDLYSVYGGLPWVGRTPFTGTEGKYDNPRLTAEATADSIVGLLDEAIASNALPWKYYDGPGIPTTEDATNNTGRWTKAGAMALKAKVLLFNASPIYNSEKPYYDGNSEAEQQHIVWHGNYSAERWQRALKACEDFFVANGEPDPASNKAADVNSTVNDQTYHLNGTKGAAWEIVASGSKKTSDANKIDYYRQAYRMGYIYQGSAEVLHSTRVATVFGSQGTFSWWNWGYYTYGINRNSYCPTEEYVEMFPWSNGQPFNWEVDSLAKKIGHFQGESESKETVGQLFYKYTAVRGGWNKIGSRDPRLYENAFVCSQPSTLSWTTGTSSGDIIELWTGGQQASQDVMSHDPVTGQEVVTEKLMTAFATGYGTMKYILGEEYHRKFLQWVYLSYNEMLLMYAECLAQNDRLTEALAVCDRVRARVGLGTFTSQKSNYEKIGVNLSNKEDVLNEILRERACELGMSNNRYYDMVRYKRTDWMTKTLHGLGIFRTKQNSAGQWVRDYTPYIGNDKDNGLAEPNRFEYQRFELINRRRVQWDMSAESLEARKWLLFPIPSAEILKGYGLIQNPGWE